ILHGYQWLHADQIRLAAREKDLGDCDFQVGNNVWMKPSNNRFTSRWQEGRVSRVLSRNNAEVDRVPRHMLDIRHLFADQEESSGDEDDAVLSEESPESAVVPQPRRSNRVRQPPVWHQIYQIRSGDQEGMWLEGEKTSLEKIITAEGLKKEKILLKDSSSEVSSSQLPQEMPASLGKQSALSPVAALEELIGALGTLPPSTEEVIAKLKTQ
ncbi:hypothetical protein SK128_014173, partial [Halocaridina rubra]